MKTFNRKLAAVALLSALAPVVAQAVVTPRAMLEKSATYSLDNSVHGFRVPTVNSLGQIKFYDVIIDLTVNTDGTILNKANVLATLSPSVTTGVIAPGTYKETGGTDTCTVTNMTLTNGRIQSFFKCNNGANQFEFSVATGPVSTGHPYLAELLLRKVNTRTDVATQTWGIMTGGHFVLGTCNVGVSPGTVIGAKTNGTLIVISVLANVAPHNFYCGNTLNK